MKFAFKTEEILGYRIATQNNLHFYFYIMKTMRQKIKGGDFPKWYASLSKLDKAEYHIILEELSSKFKFKD